jgi:hypothetical protein
MAVQQSSAGEETINASQLTAEEIANIPLPPIKDKIQGLYVNYIAILTS